MRQDFKIDDVVFGHVACQQKFFHLPNVAHIFNETADEPDKFRAVIQKLLNGRERHERNFFLPALKNLSSPPSTTMATRFATAKFKLFSADLKLFGLSKTSTTFIRCKISPPKVCKKNSPHLGEIILRAKFFFNALICGGDLKKFAKKFRRIGRKFFSGDLKKFAKKISPHWAKNFQRRLEIKICKKNSPH